MALNPNDNRLFSLLKSGLWGIPPPSDLFIGISEDDWQYIFKQASKQGLMGIVYDGLAQSNKVVLPCSLQLAWAVNVDAMEQRYNKHYQTLEQLTALYRQEGLRLMLLKGLGLAATYPIPSHREGGDIDIYLFGEYEKGNSIVESLGLKVNKGKTVNPKHSVFHFKGIPIENHKWFLNYEYAFKHNKTIEDKLFGLIDYRDCETLSIGKETVYIPPPMFNAFYLIMHAVSHLSGFGVVVRHLCDWAVFLKKYHHNIDFDELKTIFTETGFLKAVQVFTSLTVHYTGLPPEYAGTLYVPDPELENKLLHKGILHPVYEDVSNIKNPLKVLYVKIIRLMEHNRMNILLHGRIFTFKYVYSILIKSLRYPRKIFRFPK
jgi:hypothetical protein